MTIRVASTVVVAACLFGCTNSGDDVLSAQEDAQAIEQLFERFMAAFNDEDVEALRSFYAGDAVLLPPGRPSIIGADAIIDQMWAPTFDSFDVQGDLPIHEIQLGGDWGFVRGTYKLRLDPRDGGDPVMEEGQYIDVVKKGPDGAWKIARAIWNTTS